MKNVQANFGGALRNKPLIFVLRRIGYNRKVMFKLNVFRGLILVITVGILRISNCPTVTLFSSVQHDIHIYNSISRSQPRWDIVSFSESQ